MVTAEPCPFCKSPNVEVRQEQVLCYVRCNNCAARGPVVRTELEVHAINVWNLSKIVIDK